MSEFLSLAYPWVKSLHVMAVISWMAGLFYLPRLFVYHAERGQNGAEPAQSFQIMEEKLLRVIMNPAMVVSWVLGLYLAWQVFAFQGGWLHAKIAAVVALSGVHGYFAKAVKSFGRGEYIKTPRYWRMMNEAPTLLMILIVVLAVVKPF